MPARITIKAELQNLLNKAQALTDANRLSQLEGERRRRAEREQLAAKKVKTEEEERRRRALDDPTMRNIRTAAMGQQQSGPEFALIPTVPVDFNLKGPYGETLSEYEPSDEGQGGIYGLARRYNNTLWGIGGGNWLLSNIPFLENLRPELDPAGGLFCPKFTKNSTITVTDETGSFEVPRTDEVGGFILTHLVAQGADLRWYEEGGTTYRLTDGSLPAGVANSFDSGTLECFIRIGSVEPFPDAGISYVQLRLFGRTEESSLPGFVVSFVSYGTSPLTGAPGCLYRAEYANDQGNNISVQNPFPSNLGGQLIHCAIVQRKTQLSIYVAGNRVHLGTVSSSSAFTGKVIYTGVGVNDVGRRVDYFNINEIYNGPSLFKSIRFTGRALYSGDSFTPPTTITGLA